MLKQTKKTFLMAAVALCFALFAVLSAPVPAKAASSQELTLTYKGKTSAIDKGDHPVSYEQIRKAFGEPANSYPFMPDLQQNSPMCYEYKEKGFLLSFMIIPESDWLSEFTVKVTSNKAALAGIKIGMPYSRVKKKLEKNYGSSLVMTQKNKKKIKLQYGSYMPVEYSFKDGKVSRMYFWHS